MIQVQRRDPRIPGQHGRLGCGHMPRFGGQRSISVQKRRLTDQTIGARRHLAQLREIHRITDIDEFFARFLRPEDVIGMHYLPTGTAQAFSR